jgi:hypothetical protein
VFRASFECGVAGDYTGTFRGEYLQVISWDASWGEGISEGGGYLQVVSRGVPPDLVSCQDPLG